MTVDTHKDLYMAQRIAQLKSRRDVTESAYQRFPSPANKEAYDKALHEYEYFIRTALECFVD